MLFSKELLSGTVYSVCIISGETHASAWWFKITQRPVKPICPWKAGLYYIRFYVKLVFVRETCKADISGVPLARQSKKNRLFWESNWVLGGLDRFLQPSPFLCHKLSKSTRQWKVQGLLRVAWTVIVGKMIPSRLNVEPVRVEAQT